MQSCTTRDEAPDKAEAELPEPGSIIAGAYRVDELLGRGGMGAVFAGRRLSDDARIAVKMMLPSNAGSDTSRRLLREARAMATIDSPHVVAVLDQGELPDERPFIVLELLEGEPLSEVIRARAPLPIAEAVDYALQACEGLAAAHARGVIHRDLKPSNLFRTGDDDAPVVKLLDFGIAKATQPLEADVEVSSLTKSNALLGSPRYMSPEQLRRPHDVDRRADIWSLGLILQQLLTGRSPFEATSVGEHFAAILSDEPAALRTMRDDAPAELERVILACLEKQRDRRLSDVAELAQALAPFGPPDAQARVARVRGLLEHARADPDAEDGGAATLRDLETTRQDTAAATVIDEPARRSPALWVAAAGALAVCATIGVIGLRATDATATFATAAPTGSEAAPLPSISHRPGATHDRIVEVPLESAAPLPTEPRRPKATSSPTASPAPPPTATPTVSRIPLTPASPSSLIEPKGPLESTL